LFGMLGNGQVGDLSSASRGALFDWISSATENKELLTMHHQAA
jgi:hypothetical protein